MKPLRIANTCAFWGDSIDASARTIAQDPDVDYLTLDYLAEVSMSILAKRMQRDASLGFANDFIEVVKSLTPAWKSGARFKIVTNAGGLNPRSCADACATVLREAGLLHMKIGVVSGDDVQSIVRKVPESFVNLETGQTLKDVVDKMVTANAYLGATPIAAALRQGADIVITGRVADPSLTVGPCLAHFGWKDSEFDPIAGATIAGHLIECGTQVTGGICTDWLDIPHSNIGFPIVEISADGSCVVTKPPGTGGAVNEQTVKEQLLYELGDPADYLSPDVTASFLKLQVVDQGNDRVHVSGASGRAPPSTLKVSATLRAGYRASGMLTIIGREAPIKAIEAAKLVEDKLKSAGMFPKQFNVETLGSGDSSRGAIAQRGDLMEIVLRISAADERKEVVERFAREIIPLVTAGPQGTTGYFEGRPSVREVFRYWPCLIDRNRVAPVVEVSAI